MFIIFFFLKKIPQLSFVLGPSAVLSKVDQKSAYKTIGSLPAQWRLQGFRWLNRYFVELRLVFGSGSAPANYDDLSGSFTGLVRALTHTKSEYIPRILDDQICITPSYLENKIFMEKYIELANEINLPLADLDDDEKCFLYRSSGKILGVFFDAKAMSWTLDENKIQRYQFQLQQAKLKPRCKLSTLQSVLGIINQVILLCPTLNAYRNAIIMDMAKAYKSGSVILSSGSMYLINGWLRVLSDLKRSFPIPDQIQSFPENCLCIIADAAGLSRAEKMSFDIGVGAAVFVSSSQDIFIACTEIWDETFIKFTFDEQGHFIGNKTTTLEAMGLVLALFHCAKMLPNTIVKLQCDNIAACYAIENGRCKGDSWASMFVTALIFVTTALECKVIPEHCPRLSSTPAVVADLLSRKDKKGREMVARLRVPVISGWPLAVQNWMKNPTCDEGFKIQLLEDFKKKILSN